MTEHKGGIPPEYQTGADGLPIDWSKVKPGRAVSLQDRRGAKYYPPGGECAVDLEGGGYSAVLLADGSKIVTWSKE